MSESEEFDPDWYTPSVEYLTNPDGSVTVVDAQIVPVPAIEAPPPDGDDPE